MMYWGQEQYRVDSALDFLVGIYSKPFIIPYWFLYAYLGVMIMLPFLRKMVKHMKKNDFKYLIIIHLVLFAALQILEYFTNMDRINISVPLACEIPIFFFIMGYYFENVFEYNKTKYLLISLISVAAVGILTYMVYWKVTGSNDYLNSDSYAYSSALILFPTVFLFITAKKISYVLEIRPKLASVIVWIGGTTFGIYLLEGVFERAASDSYFLSNRFLPPLLSWLIWVLLSFLVGCLAVSAYKLLVFGFKSVNRYLRNR